VAFYGNDHSDGFTIKKKIDVCYFDRRENALTIKRLLVALLLEMTEIDFVTRPYPAAWRATSRKDMEKQDD